MAYAPHDPWRPIPTDVQKGRLRATLHRVFLADPRAVEHYTARIAELNGLLAWVNLDGSWQFKAFVLHEGLGEGEARRAHTIRNVSKMLQMPFDRVYRACSPEGLHARIRQARRLLADESVPKAARIDNELRRIGLPCKIWWPLATKGRIFTVKQLCRHSATDLAHVPELPSDWETKIPERLATIGRCLRQQ